VAYLRVTALTSATAHDLRKLESKLLADGTRALVLDLRFCTGGELHHAGQVADELLDGGLLWRVNDGHGHVQECRANRDCLFRDLPLVVLVDDSVRGATALVAAVLKEHRHAVLIGEPTQASAWVTSLIELPEGLGTLELRTGVAELPAGGRIWEVRPNYLLVPDRKQRDAIAVWQQAQTSPEPQPDAKPPEDALLAKALTIVRDLLEKQAK
jgi:carboxyl-terminal processing protease